FFFSSRRRHTRFSRDWSSDVCSSDLVTFSPQDPNVKVAYTGQNRIQIRRLDAARFFGADFKVDMDAPASTRDIFAHLKEVAKLMVDEHEFRITARDGNRYTLTAAPQSLRWVGSFNLTLTGHRVLDE